MENQITCCGKTGIDCTCENECACRSTQECAPASSNPAPLVKIPSNKELDVTLSDTAKTLLDRTYRKLKKTSGKVVETAGEVAMTTMGIAQTAAGEVKKAVTSTASNVAEWNPINKVSQVPAGIKEVVVEAKKLSSLEDLRGQAEDLDRNIGSLVKEKEDVFLKLYKQCDHKKLWRVAGKEKLLGGSIPPLKICMTCGLAEEGKVGEWSRGFFKFTGDGKTLEPSEIKGKILRKFSQEELERMQ